MSLSVFFLTHWQQQNEPVQVKDQIKKKVRISTTTSAKKGLCQTRASFISIGHREVEKLLYISKHITWDIQYCEQQEAVLWYQCQIVDKDSDAVASWLPMTHVEFLNQKNNYSFLVKGYKSSQWFNQRKQPSLKYKFFFVMILLSVTSVACQWRSKNSFQDL